MAPAIKNTSSPPLTRSKKSTQNPFKKLLPVFKSLECFNTKQLRAIIMLADASFILAFEEIAKK